MADESGNYKKFGGEDSPKCPKLNEESKLNSLKIADTSKDDHSSDYFCIILVSGLFSHLSQIELGLIALCLLYLQILGKILLPQRIWFMAKTTGLPCRTFG